MNVQPHREGALAAPSADPFAALNEAQRSAVEHGDEPLLVIAGAGSGKTMTLASRVARLVLAGADPQRIMLVTFSRRAAQEMERRVGRVLHQALRNAPTQRAPSLPWAGTFHALGARLLREYAARIGLPDTFTVHDRADAEDLMGLVREELGLAAATRQRFPLKGTCLAIYSRCVNSALPLRRVLDDVFPWCAAWEDELKRLFGAYVRAKQAQHVLDYDDLLLYWADAIAEPALARHVGARFDHVLVDEYQDTNRLQSTILQALKPDGRGLTVVGDDAQSIYSFRAAEVRNILDFPHTFPAARVVTLERNYRSTQPILDVSNAVIAEAAQRYPKRLWTARSAGARPCLVTVADEAAQAHWVADAVLREREGGLALKSQAVLFRASHHSAALELELARRNIPFVKYGGLKFLEAAHVKDVLSVLRWAHNPRSRLAGFRVAQLVPGIGPAGARRLLDAMESAARPLDALHAFAPPAGAANDWSDLVALLEALHHSRHWPGELEQVNRWYAPHLQRLHDDAALRAGDLAQLARIAQAHGSRERFLTELTLDPPDATSDEAGAPQRDEDYLILSTIHSAKGQEWQAVTLLNAVDGCMPSDMATGSAAEIEEERRLLYVAMTRAKQVLRLMVPLRFHVHQQSSLGDRHVYASLTRFIAPATAALFEHVGPAAEAASPATMIACMEPAIDVGARLRARWT